MFLFYGYDEKILPWNQILKNRKIQWFIIQLPLPIHRHTLLSVFHFGVWQLWGLDNSTWGGWLLAVSLGMIETTEDYIKLNEILLCKNTRKNVSIQKLLPLLESLSWSSHERKTTRVSEIFENSEQHLNTLYSEFNSSD